MQIYCVTVPGSDDDSYVFAREEDATAYAIARGMFDNSVQEQTLIDAPLATRMIEEEHEIYG